MSTEWITGVLASSAVSIGLSALAVFLLRHLLVERLKSAVGHEYDARLEALRLQHTKVLDELREARTEREALRSLAFSMITSSQTAVAERKMHALEAAWQAFCDIRKSVPPHVFTVDFIGYDVRKLGPNGLAPLKNAKFLDDLKPLMAAIVNVTKVRPFLGIRTYALVHAAQSFTGLAISTTVNSFQNGGLRLWYNDPEARTLLSSVLSQSELATFAALRNQQLSWLTTYLEGQLIQSIRDEIAGGLAAQDALQQAQAILTASQAAAPKG